MPKRFRERINSAPLSENRARKNPLSTARERDLPALGAYQNGPRAGQVPIEGVGAGLVRARFSWGFREGPPRRPATFPFLFESAEIATFTPQEKIKLESDMRTERDIKNQIAYAKKEGREEERERIVENLRKIGASEEMIARAVEEK